MSSPTFGGVDVGSRSVKLVLLRDGAVIHEEIRYHAHDPLDTCRQVLAGHAPDTLVATGYGRRICEAQWGCRAVTEIRAVAALARRVGVENMVLLCGGVGHNRCVRAQLEDLLGMEVVIPGDPQTVAALGAALLAAHTGEPAPSPGGPLRDSCG